MRYMYRVEETEGDSKKELEDMLQLFGGQGFRVLKAFPSDSEPYKWRVLFEKVLSD